MKGGSEGRRLEFSTSVTLAGLSIMCDVVEAGRWSESGHVSKLAHMFFTRGYKTGEFFFIISMCCFQAT